VQTRGGRSKLEPVFCPNCMSPYVEIVPPDPEAEGEGVAESPPDEALVRCTECEYAAPRSEFVPENYR
jgi:hypothetical protein